MNDYTISTQEYKFLKGTCTKQSKKSKVGPTYTDLIHMDYNRGCIVATDGRQLRWVNSREPQPGRESMQFDPFLNTASFKRNSTTQIIYDLSTVPYPDYWRITDDLDLAEQKVILSLGSLAVRNIAKTLEAISGVANSDFDGTHGKSMVTMEFTQGDKLDENGWGGTGYKYNGHLNLTCKCDQFGLQATAKIPVFYEKFEPEKGDTFRIAFNVNFLDDIFTDLQGGTIEIRFNGELDPVWIVANDGSGALIMPVRLPD